MFLLSFSFLFYTVFSERSFKIVGNEFEMDGKVFRYLSGSFHYFRQAPEYWEDTLKKMRHGGCNAVQTYVAWNLHEPRKGQYNFDGIADVERFISLAEKVGLYVILRPGPYICAEWEFGGLPYWLLQEKGITVRSSDSIYMSHVTDWFTELFTRLKPHMYHNGGNIIMVQIENEFGSYAPLLGDHKYLEQLCDLTESLLGKETLLFTTDGASKYHLRNGAILGRAYATVDFGTGDPTANLELERYWNYGEGPYVNSEFYTGWLDHWKEEHHTVTTEAVVQSLDKMLSMNASVNFYMYIGGTNFYFYNGANGDTTSTYQPDPTSYDYDAPLTEAGDMTWKYEKIREVAKKYFDVPDLDVSNSTKKKYGTLIFSESVSLFDSSNVIGGVFRENENTMTMEDLDVDYGYVLYHTNVSSGSTLNIQKCKDRCYVFLNQQLNCVVERPEYNKCTLDNEQGGELDILVENMGRLNFGGDFVEFKGITETVRLDRTEVKNWRMTGFNLTKINELKFNKVNNGVARRPTFYKAEFNINGEPADTFINPKGWGRGVIFVNGINIGRYWTVGPQLTLYIPKYFLHSGTNTIIVFEHEVQFETAPTMTLDSTPQIDIN